MPATISSSGTFTNLSTVLDAARSNAIGNEPRLEGAKDLFAGGLGINLEVLKTMEGVQLDELRQFIQLVANAYGLLFWPAAHLVYILLKAYIQTKSDTVLGDERGTRLYVQS
jgi:hypothetical protein